MKDKNKKAKKSIKKRIKMTSSALNIQVTDDMIKEIAKDYNMSEEEAEKVIIGMKNIFIKQITN